MCDKKVLLQSKRQPLGLKRYGPKAVTVAHCDTNEAINCGWGRPVDENPPARLLPLVNQQIVTVGNRPRKGGVKEKDLVKGVYTNCGTNYGPT